MCKYFLTIYSPPFNSKRNYNQIYNNVGKEDVAQAQAFVDTWTWNSIANEGFAEIASNFNGLFSKKVILLLIGLEKVLGKGSLLSYLVSMTQRITEIHRVLKPTGSFYLHCDPTASHYLKLVLDAIFCSQGGDFRNEIIWCYTGPSRATKDFPRKHDVILRYVKSAHYYANMDAVRIPYKELHTDKGKKNSQIWGNGGKLQDENIRQQYIERGKIPEDFWLDIPSGGHISPKERLGYPTQKPESLLERIIKASSNEGDVILDCYCGCGTTISVAQKLHRNWIGIDITYQSISLILKRLEDSFGKSVLDTIAITGIPEDFEAAVALANKQDDRVRKEFEKWIVLSYSNNRAAINDKKGGDAGIDGTAFMLDLDEENQQDFKQIIFSVKSNKTLSPTVIRDLFGTMEREKAAIGYLLTLYKMPNLVKESAKYGNYENKLLRQYYPKIEVISVEEILQGKKMYLPTAIDMVKDAERKVKDGIVGKLL